MDKQIKQLKIFISLLFLLLFFASISFSAIIKKNDFDIKNKELKISSLIDEVGELKHSNLQINRQLNSGRDDLRQIGDQLEAIKNNLAAGTSLANKELLNRKLTAIQKELIKSVQEKERKISRLAVKNVQLKEEVTLSGQINDLDTFNVLVVGENKKLTDTLIVAVINPARKQISLIALPRDFYINGRKINELYFRYGIEKTAEAVREITGIATDKYIIFNFAAFTEFIDQIGGIEINVEKQIDDNSYPGAGFSYTRVVFNQGLQHMNGDSALKYARSRKSTSDFDRTRRQQQIISAAAAKLKEMNFINKLDLAAKIYAKLGPLIESDINLFEALGYYGSYKDYAIKSSNPLSTSNLLTPGTNERGQYILQPKNGRYDEIKKYVAETIKQ